MLRRTSEPFGKAGLIVAVVALIAALAGGAYAANALTGKQKKEVKKIAKKFAGKSGRNGGPGPAGPQGPKGDAGAQGAKGDSGAAGTNGTNGTNGKDGETGANGQDGKSVELFTLAKGNGGECDETGGVELTNGTVSKAVCNGADGEGGGGGGYPETLPSGRTMKGLWEVQGEQAAHLFGSAISTISFPLPLSAAPTKTILIHIGGGNTEEEEEACPGTPEAPEAQPGVFCVYAQFEPAPITLKGGAPNTFGAALLFAETDTSVGTWAVTAP